MKHQSIMEMHPEQRPDEKYLLMGPSALTDAELLAIILRCGTKEEPSTELADRLLRRDDTQEASILNLFDYELKDLRQIKGVGKVKALQIKALMELSKRIATQSARQKLDFNNPETIAAYYMEQLRHSSKECIILVMLNSTCQLIKDSVLSVGTVNASLYSAREIFLEALKYSAVNLILIHNHPSGNSAPSVNDLSATKKIKKAGKLIDIELLDHIIIGDRSYYSFKQDGIL